MQTSVQLLFYSSTCKTPTGTQLHSKSFLEEDSYGKYRDYDLFYRLIIRITDNAAVLI